MYLFDKFRGDLNEYEQRLEDGESGGEVFKDFSKDYISSFGKTFKENTGCSNFSIASAPPVLAAYTGVAEYASIPESYSAAFWIGWGGLTWGVLASIDSDLVENQYQEEN